MTGSRARRLSSHVMSITAILAMICGLLSTSTVLASPAGATTPALTWSGPDVIDQPIYGDLVSISCISSSNCVGVDDNGNAVVYDGNSWSAPIDIDGRTPIKAVSCVSASFCMVVDAAGSALTFNGSTASTPTPVDSHAALESVSCVSLSFCAAAGEDNTIWVFNGSSWAEATGNLGSGDLYSISCATSSFCEAVGDDDVVTYNGSGLTVQQIDPNNRMTSVSCPSISFCLAVDFQGNALTFDGTSWSSPSHFNSNEPNAVSCISSSFCMEADDGNNILTYNGTAWSGGYGNFGSGDLLGASCASTKFCAAVGYDQVLVYNGSTASLTTVEPGDYLHNLDCATATMCVAVGRGDTSVFNGLSWITEHHFDPFIYFHAVSCPSTTFCMAVDESRSGNAYIYDGTKWSSAIPVTGMSFMQSVSCVGPAFCAVGDAFGNVATFNGSTWSAPTRLTPAAFNANQISCISTAFCVAVSGEFPFQSFRYDGSSWSSAGQLSDQPSAVSCAASTACVVVTTNGKAMYFDGSTWSSPTDVDDSRTLTDVSCASRNFCVAVDGNGGGGYALNYDGDTWSRAVQLVSGADGMEAVSCPTTSFCAAVDLHSDAFTATPAVSVPDPPAGVIATGSNSQAMVSWTAPANDGGSPVTGYDVQYSSNGGGTWTSASTTFHTSTATSQTVTGLTNGVQYLFRVAAINAVGMGPYSAPSAAVTPGAVPSSPTSVIAVAGDKQAAVSWTTPSDDGGSLVTGYDVQYSSDAGTHWTSASAAFHASTATSETVTGLTNGTSYVFRVAAINKFGTGAYSTPSSAVTPVAAPGAPSGVGATAGDAQATVTWTAPTDDGGSAVTGYDVQYSADGGASWTSGPAAFHISTATSQTVTGLINGTSYVFRVAAINMIGTGTYSTPSTAVTPAADTTSLSIGRDRRIVASQHVVASTTLTDSVSGAPVSGASVTLLRRVNESRSWNAVRQVATDANGTASVEVSPHHNTDYRWTYAGDAAHTSTRSPIETVTVRPLVIAKITDSRVKKGTTTQIYGTVAPKEAGHAVRLQRRAHGRWVNTDNAARISRQKLPDGSIATGYVITLSDQHAGRYKYRVHRAATGRSAAGNSDPMRLRVTR